MLQRIVRQFLSAVSCRGFVDSVQTPATDVGAATSTPTPDEWWRDAKPFVPNLKGAIAIDVYDGDTFTLAVRVDGRPTTFKVRIYGVDCPEMRTEDATEHRWASVAKEYVEKRILFNSNARFVYRKQDKYGRLLCDVFVPLSAVQQRHTPQPLTVAAQFQAIQNKKRVCRKDTAARAAADLKLFAELEAIDSQAAEHGETLLAWRLLDNRYAVPYAGKTKLPPQDWEAYVVFGSYDK